MEKKKLKVIWLCHFSNKELQDKIKPIKRVNEYAPWISGLIKLFENNESIELHIISQHEWLTTSKHFTQKGIHYHIVRRGIPIIGRHWPGFFRFDLLTDYFFWKIRSKHIINKVKPDIIHLHGAENEFCSTILQFYNKYPVFITIQGFIGKSNMNSKAIRKKQENELEILTKFNHYGYRTNTMGEDIKAINPNAILIWHKYPLKKIHPIETYKKFDIVFFARISKDKGIEDLIKAIYTIKKNKPDITLCVIGGGNYSSFQDFAYSLGLTENITWAGFQPTQEDVHKMASQAKISVLPTYHDIISGTILESLFLKLPVVAYNVGSIHEVNEKDEIISLVDKLDVAGLAKAIEHLLDNPDILKERAEKGYLRAQEMFTHSDEEIRNSLLDAYQKVINDFNPLS